MLLRAALVVSSLWFAPQASAAPPVPRDAMLAHLQSQELQGAVWSTVGADGSVAVDAAGIRDARSGAAMHADDRVQVGSVAKSLVATGVLLLVSRERLALDTPVADVLPAIAFDNPWAATDPVRLRHLLDHTAGLDDARLAQIFSLKPTADTPLAEAFRDGGPLRVRSRPGSRHSYSNSGYTLLGMAIEAATGERYETWLEANLLQPLGMHESTFAFVTQAGDARLAMGHFEDGVVQAAVPTYLRPAMQFTTTAADMARFARFLMSDGRIGSLPSIDAALLQAMGRPVDTEAALAGLRVGYGLGLATRDRHGAIGRCHGGNTVGYRAMLCVFPEAQRAFFVAVNADVEGADYGGLDRVLVDALQLPRAPAAPAAELPDDIGAWAGYYVPSPNRFARFAWLDTTLGFARLRADATGLQFAPFQAPEIALSPVAPRLYRAPDRTVASHALVLTPEGRRVVSTGLQSYERIATGKLVALWLSLAAGLLGLTWLLLAGLLRLALQRRAAFSRPAFVPFLGVAALALPLPLFLRQSFLQLGEATPASVVLAAVTLLLPLTMLIGIALAWRRRPSSLAAKLDLAAMLAALQWSVVLTYWGLLPLRLWA